MKKIEDDIERLNGLMITMLHRSLARVGYATQPILGATGLGAIIVFNVYIYELCLPKDKSDTRNKFFMLFFVNKKVCV